MSLNVFVAVGRICSDIFTQTSQDGKTTITKFRIAVDRKYKAEKESADFIPCIAFNKTAEFVNKYFTKGQKIALNGHLQSGSYQNKNGQTVYTLDVIVSEVEFAESKLNSPNKVPTETAPVDQGFMQVADNLEDEGLPFN